MSYNAQQSHLRFMIRKLLSAMAQLSGALNWIGPMSILKEIIKYIGDG